MLEYTYIFVYFKSLMEIQKLFYAILEIASEKKYSDIHLNTSSLPVIRNNSGHIEQISTLQIDESVYNTVPLSLEQVQAIMKIIVTEK